MVRDKRIFKINLITLDSRIQYLAVQQLRVATEHLKGKERIRKMKDLAA